MSFGLGFWAAAGGPSVPTDFELISTTIVGSGGVAGGIAFTSIPQGYKHLQVRATAQSIFTGNSSPFLMYLNFDSATNYSWHSLYGNGSSVLSTGFANTDTTESQRMPNANATNIFGGAVFDILDYTNTSKNKTIRSLAGYARSGENFVSLSSGAWRNTAAVTRIDINGYNGVTQFSRFSLYGIKG
jgi:hypothetical protein